ADGDGGGQPRFRDRVLYRPRCRRAAVDPEGAPLALPPPPRSPARLRLRRRRPPAARGRGRRRGVAVATVAPYGSWDSPISARDVASGGGRRRRAPLAGAGAPR